MMKIKSDKMKGYMKKKEEMMKDMSPEMKKIMGKEDCMPVDMNGHFVPMDKHDSSNMKKMVEDIKEVHGLEDY